MGVMNVAIAVVTMMGEWWLLQWPWRWPWRWPSGRARRVWSYRDDLDEWDVVWWVDWVGNDALRPVLEVLREQGWDDARGRRRDDDFVVAHGVDVLEHLFLQLEHFRAAFLEVHGALHGFGEVRLTEHACSDLVDRLSIEQVCRRAHGVLHTIS